MNKIFKNKDFFWNTLGSLAFGFTSLIYLIIITRINGVDLAGAFTYAFATANILYTIGSYCGKTYQITETSEKILDSDYINNRFLTCLLMNIVGICFCFVTHSSDIKFVMIILLTFYRSIDAFIESFHAILQRNGYLYRAGMSMFFKTLVLIIGFYIIDIFTKNLYYCFFYLIIVEVIFMILCDYQMTKKFIKKQKFSFKINNYLLKTSFSTFVFYLLASYVISAPRYIINYISTDEIQAIFGIIFMPSSFLALISIYIVQPLLNKITVYIKNNNYNYLKKLINKLTMYILEIGIFGFIACCFFGIPILNFLYGVNLDSQLINLLIIIVGSIFYSVVCMLSAVIIALRKTSVQLLIMIIDAVIGFACSYFLVANYSILGASLSYLIIMFTQLLLYEFAIWYNLNKR